MNNSIFVFLKNPFFLLLSFLTISSTFIVGVLVGTQLQAEQFLNEINPDEVIQKSPQPRFPPDSSMMPIPTLSTSRPSTSNECVPAGCSGQLCVEADQAANSFTTCEFRPEYACYKDFGICERQNNGNCGWTNTPEFKQCLQGQETKIQLDQ